MSSIHNAGVEASLDHIDSLGAKIVYLTSIFKERNATSTDTGYDIVDHGDVDPVLGSLEDFDSLVAAATEKGNISFFLLLFSGFLSAWPYTIPKACTELNFENNLII